MVRDLLLFRGCLIPTRLPYLERSSRLVLDKLGIRYELMPAATCCIEPIGLRSMGLDTWLASAARLLSIAEEQKKEILTICNGCYMSLKEAHHLLKSSENLSKANEILQHIGREYHGGTKVHHLTGLIRGCGEERVRSLVTVPQEKLRIATHPGCHMIRPSQIMRLDNYFRPSLLNELTAWTGAQAISSEEWPSCCGGTLTGVDEALSSKILSESMGPMLRSGATHIMTPCPFCFFQFDVKQKKLPVLFISEILALSFGASADEIGLKYHKVPINAR